ncbi:MAG: hypothetical protein JWM41_917 [Gemmatimonadetes bacterium]|nr:hypothetical protein [Gemmatimonadota bacterium]
MRARFLAVALLLCGACAASTTDVATTAKTYTGTYSAQVVESTVSTSLTGGGTFPCTNTYTMAGTMTMTIDQVSGAMVGSAQIAGMQTETAHSSAASCAAKGNLATSWAPKLTGTTADIHFDDQSVATNAGYAVTSKTSFAGTLSGGVVSGVLGFSVAGSGTLGGVTSVVQSYSSTMNVTLR